MLQAECHNLAATQKFATVREELSELRKVKLDSEPA